MKSKFSISFKRMFIIALVLTVLLTSVNIPITVNAAGTGAITEGIDYSDPASSGSKYEGKWISTYAKGTGYKGEGVLMYLLERNGGGKVANTVPVAFPCSATAKSYTLKATPKYGGYDPVTTWQSTVPYWSGQNGNAPGGDMLKPGGGSRVQEIKAWLQTKTTTVSGEPSTKGIDMVEAIWGSEICQRFSDEEIILIIEPIIATQFSQSAAWDYFDYQTYYNASVSTIYSKLKTFKSIMTDPSNPIAQYTGMSSDLRNEIDEFIDWMNEMENASYTPSYEYDEWRSDALTILGIIATIRVYMPLGEPMAGTANELINYYGSLNTYTPPAAVVGVFNALGIQCSFTKAESGYLWYRNYAQRASVITTNTIVCKDANMNLWPVGKSAALTHTQASILNDKYTTGMIAMLAWTTDDIKTQTTYDEPQKDTPAPPADESDGYCTIIKSYRDTNITTGVQTHVGTYHRNQVANLITIENEPTYKVVAWKTSNQGNTSISSINWENSVPGLIDKSGTTPTTVTLPATHDYLYVLLEKTAKDPALDANYTLSQSSITRHVNLNNPDQWSGGSGATSFTMQNLSTKVFYY